MMVLPLSWSEGRLHHTGQVLNLHLINNYIDDNSILYTYVHLDHTVKIMQWTISNNISFRVTFYRLGDG